MPQQSNNSRSGVAIVLLLAVLVPVLYVLSIGPAAWLTVNGHIEIGTLKNVYYHVPLIAYESETLGSVLDWYVEMCGGENAKLYIVVMYVEGSTSD